eukprot:CAMPEP_0172483378 /NCGR_PEP_ID=MMETSP1066-20121228/10359_1 /TAXON_ID=671091 /ORGANISM="Coscinodiscus wailesii, Strain CCMP2513" /LENGTH=62 /DNA_ID=CAMNT_0013247213 /DNA_START=29 /DNA_END=214 /DNA_ORIENTATION=+
MTWKQNKHVQKNSIAKQDFIASSVALLSPNPRTSIYFNFISPPRRFATRDFNCHVQAIDMLG